MNGRSAKDFLLAVSKMMKEIGEHGKYSEDTRQCIIETYAQMSESEQISSLKLICGAASETYSIGISMMAELLRVIKDLKIIECITGILTELSYPLWERINDTLLLRSYLFTYSDFEGYQTYRNMNLIYKTHLDEIWARGRFLYDYIPHKKRNKKIVIILSQMLGVIHSPTNWTKVIADSYGKLSYDVECFVCHIKGTESCWDWKNVQYFNNFMDVTGQFQRMLGDVKINGYNFTLNASDYIEQLEKAVKMIWDRKPEYVLEIGEATILAGLCASFTTVVTMGCTKNMPVTNAPLIALQKDYSKEELKMWNEQLGDAQKMTEVKMFFRDAKGQDNYKKADFGISEEDFVIIIAGNRLDEEVTKEFLEIVYRILDLEACFKVAVIGVCPDLEARVLNGGREARFFFLGGQKKFRETIAMGDVFLNPPRIGGGSGGMFSILEEVPVITLDHCDVESIAGADFVCNSIEEMAPLAHRYYADAEFMNRQKENCRKAALRHTGIDNKQSLRKLSEDVRAYAKEVER